jgi:hypothetical protein
LPKILIIFKCKSGSQKVYFVVWDLDIKTTLKIVIVTSTPRSSWSPKGSCTASSGCTGPRRSWSGPRARNRRYNLHYLNGNCAEMLL